MSFRAVLLLSLFCDLAICDIPISSFHPACFTLLLFRLFLLLVRWLVLNHLLYCLVFVLGSVCGFGLGGSLCQGAIWSSKALVLETNDGIHFLLHHVRIVVVICGAAIHLAALITAQFWGLGLLDWLGWCHWSRTPNLVRLGWWAGSQDATPTQLGQRGGPILGHALGRDVALWLRFRWTCRHRRWHVPKR